MDPKNLIRISRFVDMRQSVIDPSQRLDRDSAIDDKFRQIVEYDQHEEQDTIVKVYNNLHAPLTTLETLADTLWVLAQTQNCFAFDFQDSDGTEGLAYMELRQALKCLEQCIWHLHDASHIIDNIKTLIAQTRNWVLECDGEEIPVYDSSNNFINALALAIEHTEES